MAAAQERRPADFRKNGVLKLNDALNYIAPVGVKKADDLQLPAADQPLILLPLVKMVLVVSCLIVLLVIVLSDCVVRRDRCFIS